MLPNAAELLFQASKSGIRPRRLMGEIDVDLLDAEPNDNLDRLGKTADRLRAEDAVGFQGNPGPGQYSGNERRQMIECPLFSLEILGRPIEAQRQ